MNEDFVSFSLAKKLKKKDYTLDTAHHYDDNGGIVVSLVEFDERCVYPCPEIHQVLKWLREEKKIHICIGICIAPTFSWDYEIVNLDDDCYIHAECGYDSYEDAASNGISYLLDNLI